MRFFVFFLLIALALEAHSQVKILLGNSPLPDTKGLRPVGRVIDARKDKNIIGIVQRGLNNRKDIAVFKNRGLADLEMLLKRSDLLNEKDSLVLRISNLQISEITEFRLKETSKAEMSAEFFRYHAGYFYYLASYYATSELLGSTGNYLHSKNIKTSVQKIFEQFNNFQFEEDTRERYSLEELSDPELSFRDLSGSPLLISSRYKDGYYVSFDEFLNNTPSVDIGCGSFQSKASVKCDDEIRSADMYGFAKDNKLFVQFHRAFYPIEREGNIFYFLGPREKTLQNIRDLSTGWWVAGALGASLAKKSHNYKAYYIIDLATGSIKNVSGI